MKIILIFIALVLSYILADLGIAVMKQDHRNYLVESKCVARYIAYGVERRDITTGNGKCEVKGSYHGQVTIRKSRRIEL